MPLTDLREMVDRRHICECFDKGCPAHPAISRCEHRHTQTLRRVDMENARVRFCAPCADDALASGVFAETSSL